MLYERWREVARARGAEAALRDVPEGRAWTFAQLLDWSDRCEAPAGPWVFPRGMGAEFVLEVLRGWRHGRVICPLEEYDAAPDLPKPPKEIAHLKRTSATTGAARFVAFTAEQLAADPANIAATMGLRPGWPNIGVISLAHSYGFSNLVLPLLLQGIPLWLLKSPLPEPLRQLCAGGGEFALAGVPVMWRVWHEAGAILPNVRLAISAGAPLPLALERGAFEMSGVKIHNFLGSSECGGIAYDRTATPRTDAAMAGTALENVSISAVDGMLEVRGPAVGEGYWPEARTELGGGVFRTGDLVEIRERQLFMRGRATDVIHVAGRKVAPEEIERAIMACAGVRECLVFDAPRGEENQIVAVVVGGDEGCVRSSLRLPTWQIPRVWFFLPSLAANERGKVSRARWREKFTAGDLTK